MMETQATKDTDIFPPIVLTTPHPSPHSLSRPSLASQLRSFLSPGFTQRLNGNTRTPCPVRSLLFYMQHHDDGPEFSTSRSTLGSDDGLNRASAEPLREPLLESLSFYMPPLFATSSQQGQSYTTFSVTGQTRTAKDGQPVNRKGVERKDVLSCPW